MDYMLIVAILAYIGAAQLLNKFGTGPVLNSLVAVGIPYGYNFVVNWIYISGHKLPIIENLFSLTSVLTLFVQFAASMLIFKRLQNEESISELLIWAAGGAILIIFFIPFVIHKIGAAIF